jgi:hypothetical protein
LSLSLYDHDDSSTGAEESAPVAEAFAANTSLEYLCLFDIPIIVDGFDEDLVGHILRQLHSHPKLHTLVLRAHDVFENLTIPAALPALLQNNAAKHPVSSKLQTIHLESFNIKAEDWESTLGVALRCHAQNPITIILEHFCLDAGATQGLVHLIQTEPSTADSSSSSSTVTDLRVVDPIGYLQDPHNLVHLLVPSLPNPLVRVSLLDLELSTLAQLQVLASSLAQAKFLTTLRFVYKGEPVNGVSASRSQISLVSKLLVQGLEHNESLLVLEGIEEYGEWTMQRDPFFSPRLQRKVEAYLERNRHLAAVLASTLTSPTTTTTTDATPIPVVAATANTTIGPRQDLAPSLLVSASPAPRMLATQLVKNLNNAQVANSTLLFGPTVGTLADTQEPIL